MYATALKMHGFPEGCANDAATMTASLDLWDLGGLGALCEYLTQDDAARVPADVTVRDTNDGAILHANGQSLLLIGAAVLDLACAEFGHQTCVLNDITNSAFAAGLAALCQPRGMDAVVEWQLNGEQHALCTIDELRITRTSTTDAENALAKSQMKIHSGARAHEVKRNRPSFQSPRAVALKTIEAQSIHTGVEVDDKNWQRVVALANEILVPENEQSRSGGAGVGADGD